VVLSAWLSLHPHDKHTSAWLTHALAAAAAKAGIGVVTAAPPLRLARLALDNSHAGFAAVTFPLDAAAAALWHTPPPSLPPPLTIPLTSPATYAPPGVSPRWRWWLLTVVVAAVAAGYVARAARASCSYGQACIRLADNDTVVGDQYRCEKSGAGGHGGRG